MEKPIPLYNDGTLYAFNKEAGLLTHRSPLSSDRDSLVDRLTAAYSPHPSPVHRLDRPTSGIVLCTAEKEAARRLTESFTERKVSKTYHAVLRGWCPEEGCCRIPLNRDGAMIEAKTLWKRLGTIEIDVANNRFPTSRYSLVEVYPKTGRFHQIRRHFARMGYPLIGDTGHGDLRHNRIFASRFGIGRLILHASAIHFPHPVSGDLMELKAPLPAELEQLFTLFT